MLRDAEHLIQPKLLLPLQVAGGCRGAASATCGEYRLMLEILEDAVRSFQSYARATDRRGRRLFAETERWIMRDDTRARFDTNPPRFSFEYICAVVGLDPDYVREGLHSWLAEHGGPAHRPTPIIRRAHQ
jgi:hypothetical protein